MITVMPVLINKKNNNYISTTITQNAPINAMDHMIIIAIANAATPVSNDPNEVNTVYHSQN